MAMRVLLNCDQVFDVLTRGPFPAGRPEDEAVERHLASCSDCRSLAEALRPAVAIFHESLAPDEPHSLPEYHGRLPENDSAVQPHPRLAVRREGSDYDLRSLPLGPDEFGRRGLGFFEREENSFGGCETGSARPMTNRRGSGVHVAFRRWAALAAGLMLAFVGGAALVGMASSLRQFQAQPELFAAGGSASPRPARLTQEGRRELGLLGLKQVCFPSSVATDALVTATELVCCTQCHAEAAAGAAPALRVSVGRLQQSCLACHQG